MLTIVVEGVELIRLLSLSGGLSVLLVEYSLLLPEVVVCAIVVEVSEVCVEPFEDDGELDSVFIERHLSSVQESTLVVEDNGHQVVYSVTTPFVVVVIVETE